MRSPVYDAAPLSRGRIPALLGGLAVTLLILLVLPLTRLLNPPAPQQRTWHEIEIVRDPPEPPPPEPPAPEEHTAAQQPELAGQPEPLDLSQLEIALRPGVGDALAGSISLHGFALAPTTSSELDIFEVSDLDRVPRVINRPRLVVPQELARDGIRGTVRLQVRIDPNGRVTVLGVESADHPRLIDFARRYAERCLFESPTRGGQKVSTRYTLPITY